MVAWQTWIVITLVAVNFAVTLMLGNVEPLGLKDKPWLTLIILPTVAALVTAASNQLKSVGQAPPANNPPTQ